MTNKQENPTTPIADNANHEGIRMWPSLGTANWLYDVANIGLIIGLAIGIISTILIVWMGNIKEEYLKRNLAATTERAANAELRAAEANQKAEAEHLARVKIEEKLAPRSLSQAQRKILSDKLTPFARTVAQICIYPGVTSDAILLSKQILFALSDAKWNVAIAYSLSGLPSGVYFPGVFIALKDTSDTKSVTAAKSLMDGLNSEGIDTSMGTGLFTTDEPLTGDVIDPSIVTIKIIILSK